MADATEVQLKRGVLELCVLAHLAAADNYAYEIATFLAREIGMGEGTIYPLMRRMQADALLDGVYTRFNRNLNRLRTKASERGQRA